MHFPCSQPRAVSFSGLAFLVCGACIAWGSAQNSEKGLSLIPSLDQPKAFAFNTAKESGQLESVGSGWFRVTTLQKPPKKYGVSINVNSSHAIAQGKSYLLEFEAKTLISEDETGAGQVYCYVEHGKPPFEKALMQTVSIPRMWTTVQLPFQAKFGIDAGKGRLGLGFGFLPQVLEIRAVKLTQLPEGADPNRFLSTEFAAYDGQHKAAVWRKEALQRIDRNRKAWLNILVVDKGGKPVSDAALEIKHQRHLFGFGCCVDAIALVNRTPAGERYREYVLRNFNKVVFQGDMKWKAWDEGRSAPVSARFSRQALLESLGWLERNRIDVRGHLLVHNVLDQNSFRGRKTRGHLLEQIDTHIADEVTALKGRIVEWDVVNHPVGWGKRLDELTGRDVFVGFYDRVWEIDPKAKRYINEGNILPGGNSDEGTRRKEYEDWISFLLRNNAKLDGIGFMGHFDGATLTSPMKVYELLDRFGRFGLDLQITEFDVAGVSEQLQADYLRDILIAAYSHPKVVGVVQWGFWEGLHWKPDAALVRKDFSLKPAALVWDEWVNTNWRTNEMLRSNSLGSAKLRAYQGEYEIVARLDGRTATRKIVLKKDETVTLELR